MGDQRIVSHEHLSRPVHISEPIRVGGCERTFVCDGTDNLAHIGQADPSAMIVILQHVNRDIPEHIVMSVNRKPEVLPRFAPDAGHERDDRARYGISEER